MNNLPRYKSLDMWHYRKLRKKLNKKFSVIYGITMILFLLFTMGCAIFSDFLLRDYEFWLYFVLFMFLIVLVGGFIWFCVESFKILKQINNNKREGRFSTLIYTKFNNPTQLYSEVCNALLQMGYQLQNYNGEEVFLQESNPMVSVPKYIKIQIQGNIIIATCWIYNGKEYALGDYPYCDSLTTDMDNLSNYFDF